MSRRLLLALLVFASGGCAPSYDWVGLDVSSGRSITVAEHELAPGQTFDGTYRSPQWGRLRLRSKAERVAGDYVFERDGCRVYGALSGTIAGNLLTFRWREDRRECGLGAAIEGRGFFLYDALPGSSRARLFGRWGYAWSERAGGALIAVKLPSAAAASATAPSINDREQ